MDLKDILKLIDRLETSSVTHVSVEEDGKKVVVKKQVEVISGVPAQGVTHYEVPQPVAAEAAPVASEPESDGADIAYITSPIVGTFYASPNPTAGPFVSRGDAINKGKVLCIIEAMKLMNEIESDFDGEILDILVKNEEMVEFGQKLFKVRLK